MSKSLTKPIEIKISTVVAISAILHAADPLVIDAALKQMTGGASDFFDDEFAVLDVTHITGANIEWDRLVALFKKYRLNAVAVRGSTPDMERQIRAHGLTLDDGGGHSGASGAAPAASPTSASPAAPTPDAPPAVTVRPAPVPGVTAQPPVTPPAAPAPNTPAVPGTAAPPPPSVTQAPAATVVANPGAMIIDQPVRAGQRIYARGCDLIVTAAVNHGAEIIADGSIHVYAPLKGRALAGAAGNAEARIFAQAMEPELVSIAGVYRTFDDGFPADLAQKPAQCKLTGDRLDIVALTQASRP